jgi:demethylmenaquinone methyltransferase/2-methoxy-6-polyprenyl-1,4-benzoquinol methylase
MKTVVQQSMYTYYDERASEFDEIYIGKGPALISDPEAYKIETTILARLVERYCQGNHLDIACGTGFWLPHYAKKCHHITLVDQSEKMLEECRKKAVEAGVLDKCQFICAEILNYRFPNNHYDSVLFGFFLSHLTSEQEAKLFTMLRTLLMKNGTFLILDSIWNAERSTHRKKEGKQDRLLNDGRRFEIYKKYFTTTDFVMMAEAHDADVAILHEGRTFIAVQGKFKAV